MTRFHKILVAVDTRLDTHPIVDEAANIARQNNASSKIVDVVPEFPWTARMTHSGSRESPTTDRRRKTGQARRTCEGCARQRRGCRIESALGEDLR